MEGKSPELDLGKTEPVPESRRTPTSPIQKLKNLAALAVMTIGAAAGAERKPEDIPQSRPEIPIENRAPSDPPDSYKSR